MRSGKLCASNDVLIEQLINDADYVINDDGTIFTYLSLNGAKNTGTLRPKSIKTNEFGYCAIKYKNKQLQVHRIVYRKFIGILDQDLTINHKDGNPSNNKIDNLELVTQSDNNKHSFKMGRKPTIGNKVINFEIAQEIREKKKLGYTHSQLVAEYGLSKGHISEIVNNKIWV